MDSQLLLRKELLNYLKGRHAHALLEDAVKNFPDKMMNEKPQNVPFSFWALLEHIRISQNDVVDFVLHPDYQYKDWPNDYWPGSDKKATKKMWQKTLAEINKDFATLIKIVNNSKTDLLTKIPHGEGQTIFREAVLVIDHNAYHIGEFILMRRVMGIWKN